MKFRKLTWIVLLVVLAMVLAACGGDDDDNGGDGGDEVNLSQSLSGTMEEVGSYTVQYPEGWVGQADDDGGTLMIAINQAALDKANTPGVKEINEGEVAASMMVLPEMIYFLFEIPEDGGPEDAIAGFITSMASEESTEANLSDPETFDANGKSAALASGTITENGTTTGAIVATVAVDGGVGIIIFVTHPDEVDDYIATARAMAGEFEFTPVAPE